MAFEYDTIINETGEIIENRVFLTVPFSTIKDDGSFNRYSIGTAINGEEKSLVFVIDRSLISQVEELIIKSEDLNFWLEEKVEGTVTIAETTNEEMPVFLNDEIVSLNLKNTELENKNMELQGKLDMLEGAVVELIEQSMS